MNQSFSSRYISLYDLCALIRVVIGDNFPEYLWIVAEIASIRENQNGHCYLELVDKSEERIVAQVRATIWAYNYRTLTQAFEKATGETLKKGMKILFNAQVQYHEVYGMSLNIKDIDPTFSTGEMARKKREVIERLLQEGLMESNKSLPLPPVPQRIAVISSPSAAGYGDFCAHLQENSYLYKFFLILFPALVQGEEAAASIVMALQHIKKQLHNFDVVVLIRGGGSQVDLYCFDDYTLSAEIARFPLPVITGIGHERDDTVVDMVAHTKKKTPTAVAEFIISGVRMFETRVEELQNTLARYAERLLESLQYEIQEKMITLSHTVKERISHSYAQYQLLVMRLCSVSRYSLNHHQNQFYLLIQKEITVYQKCLNEEVGKYSLLEQTIRHFDPIHLMKRGFSIARVNGIILTCVQQVENGQTIVTQVLDGYIHSKVEGRS